MVWRPTGDSAPWPDHPPLVSQNYCRWALHLCTGNESFDKKKIYQHLGTKNDLAQLQKSHAKQYARLIGVASVAIRVGPVHTPVRTRVSVAIRAAAAYLARAPAPRALTNCPAKDVIMSI